MNRLYVIVTAAALSVGVPAAALCGKIEKRCVKVKFLEEFRDGKPVAARYDAKCVGTVEILSGANKGESGLGILHGPQQCPVPGKTLRVSLENPCLGAHDPNEAQPAYRLRSPGEACRKRRASQKRVR